MKAVTSLVLIAAQLASLLAAPLFVCTASGGRRTLDFGRLACACHDEAAHVLEEAPSEDPCPADRDHGPPTGDAAAASDHGDCDCHHQPLVEPGHPGAAVIRWPAPVAPGLGALPPRLACGPGSCTAATAARWNAFCPLDGPLGDWKSICLRC